MNYKRVKAHVRFFLSKMPECMRYIKSSLMFSSPKK
jgi:hypothetical protein